MAYLTERFTKQESSVSNKKSAVVTPKSGTADSGDVVENTNFQIAKNLNTEKHKLIKALAQFPATALWLLSKYEKNIHDADADEEEQAATDLHTAILAIKKQFAAASQVVICNNTANDAGQDECRSLANGIADFPFTFEDLHQLVDFYTYICSVRNIDFQSLALSRKQLFCLGKRRESLKTASENLFEAMQNSGFAEEFLILSGEQMRQLFVQIVTAEQLWLDNRQKLASANSRLVLFIANQYKGGFLDFDDLVQEGQTGLLKAVDRFNYQLGFQFSTYAGYWIRQAISRALTRCERVVRLPFGQMATINKVFRGKEELIAKCGKEPTRTELAEHVGLSVEDINTILSISQTAMAFDSDEDDEDPSGAPANFIEQCVFGHCFADIAATELQKLICGAISTLNDREAKIICSHFGIHNDNEKTLQEIGVELNLTRERVRQIQVMALNKIRLGYGEQLMSFL